MHSPASFFLFLLFLLLYSLSLIRYLCSLKFAMNLALIVEFGGEAGCPDPVGNPEQCTVSLCRTVLLVLVPPCMQCLVNHTLHFFFIALDVY